VAACRKASPSTPELMAIVSTFPPAPGCRQLVKHMMIAIIAMVMAASLNDVVMLGRYLSRKDRLPSRAMQMI
jgi:hypothetical protein